MAKALILEQMVTEPKRNTVWFVFHQQTALKNKMHYYSDIIGP